MVDDGNRHDAEYGLVMPFVVVASKGGPFEDGAYVSGYEMGLLDAALTVSAALDVLSVFRTIRADNMPQADLLAMRHGFDAGYSATEDGWGWRHLRRFHQRGRVGGAKADDDW